MVSQTLLRLFQAKKPAFGAWLCLPCNFAARTVAQASPHLSWILIDCEHGLISLVPGAAEAVTAIQGAVPNGGPTPIVRIPATGISASTSWQIKLALDSGAGGVMVPMVSTVEKAKEVVADCRFPPVGRRGFGSPFTHAIWGVTASEYLDSANRDILVIVQIENREGVENVHAIAEVDGIDVLFIGPYDLSISLGYPTPSPDPHPEVEKAIQRILRAAHAFQKKCAIYCTTGEQSAKRAKEGFDMINVITDTGAITQAISNHLSVAMGS